MQRSESPHTIFHNPGESKHRRVGITRFRQARLVTRGWQLNPTRILVGAHVHDAGRLVKPEEAIKYPFKPAELERLEGPALAWVYREARGLKLAQPLGEFAEFWRELDRRRLKVLLVDGPDGAKLHLGRHVEVERLRSLFKLRRQRLYAINVALVARKIVEGGFKGRVQGSVFLEGLVICRCTRKSAADGGRRITGEHCCAMGTPR